MKFLWTTIHVSDMEKSLAFYKEFAGLDVTRRHTSAGDREIAFLGEGETKVELIFDPSSTQVHHSKDISIGFAVASMDEQLKFITERGLAVESGPFEPNPHVRFFYVLDPNGVKVQFLENR